MHDEFDYEIDQTREWLGLDHNGPLTFGDWLWMFVQLASLAAFILGFGLVAGIKTGAI